MSQSKTQTHDVVIINATAQELKDYAQKVKDNNTTAKDFCQYLKEIHKLSAKEVVADLSGQTFSTIIFHDIDFGNIIASKHKVGQEKIERPTLFQHCMFKNCKFRSNASMEGLEFTHCDIKNSSFIGDLENVTFGLDSDISQLNISEAYNIDKCIIDPSCQISEVKLGFPDLETFKSYIADKFDIQKQNNETNSSYRRDGEIPKAPIVEHTTSQNQSQEVAKGSGFGGWAWGGLVKATTGMMNATKGAASYVTSGVGAFVTMNVEEEYEVDPVKLHENAIQRILASNPTFTPSIKDTALSDKAILTRVDIEEWLKFKKANNNISLKDYIIAITGEDSTDLVPHIEKLDLSGLDFSNADFGNVIISQCVFSNSTFDKVNLNLVSVRDCDFSNATFNEVSAAGADFTRSKFCGAKIDNTSFEGARMVDTDFSEGNLPTQISNSNLNHSNMRSASLDNMMIKNTSLNHTNMQNVEGDSTILLNVAMNQTNLSNAELTDMAIKDSDMKDTIAHDANMEGAAMNNVTINQLNAQAINLNNIDAQNVTITDSDLSGGTMNQAILAGVIIDNSNMVNVQAQEIKTFTSEIAIESSKTEQTIKADLADSQKENKLAIEEANRAMHNIDEIVEALEAQKPAQGLVISNTDARALDLSGGHLVDTTLNNINGQHAQMQNMVIENSEIKDSNLHGANLAGANGDRTTLYYTNLEGNNLTDTNLGNVTMAGGTFKQNDISGANITHTVIGTQDAKVELEKTRGDVATNLAHTTFNAVNPDTKIEITIPDGTIISEDPNKLAEKHKQQEAIIENVGTASMVGAKASKIAHDIGKYAGSMSSSLKDYKKSKLGTYIGIGLGITCGLAVTAFATSTFGLGLIPMAVIGAITVGGMAVGGAFVGDVAQNTNPGRNILTLAAAGLASTFLGPLATIAIPGIIMYNTFTGKNSPIKGAIGSGIDTFIAKPMNKISEIIGNFTFSEKNIYDAMLAKQTRQERYDKLKTEEQAVKSLSQDTHSQNTDIAKQQAANKLHHQELVSTNPSPTLQKEQKAPERIHKKKVTWADTFQQKTESFKQKAESLKANAKNMLDKVGKKPSTSYVNAVEEEKKAIAPITK